MSESPERKKQEKECLPKQTHGSKKIETTRKKILKTEGMKE